MDGFSKLNNTMERTRSIFALGLLILLAAHGSLQGQEDIQIPAEGIQLFERFDGLARVLVDDQKESRPRIRIHNWTVNGGQALDELPLEEEV